MKRNKEARCPNCKHRLFDILPDTNGKVEIKCPQCKAVITIDISNNIPNIQSKSEHIAV